MFNWVDFIILCIIVRYFYIAKKSEFIPEAFKFMGVLLATIFGIHYYQNVNEAIQKYFLIPEGLVDFFAFLLIVVLVVLIFVLIREGWMIILKMKMHPAIDKGLGLVLCLVRGYLVCGIAFFALVLLRDKRVEASVESALSYKIFRTTSAAVYHVSYVNIIGKFFPNEKVNKDILHKPSSDIRQERRAKKIERSQKN